LKYAAKTSKDLEDLADVYQGNAKDELVPDNDEKKSEKEQDPDAFPEQNAELPPEEQRPKTPVKELTTEETKAAMDEVFAKWATKEKSAGKFQINRICHRHAREQEKIMEERYLAHPYLMTPDSTPTKPKISPRMRMLNSMSRKSISPNKLNYMCHGPTSTHNPDA